MGRAPPRSQLLMALLNFASSGPLGSPRLTQTFPSSPLPAPRAPLLAPGTILLIFSLFCVYLFVPNRKLRVSREFGFFADGSGAATVRAGCRDSIKSPPALDPWTVPSRALSGGCIPSHQATRAVASAPPEDALPIRSSSTKCAGSWRSLPSQNTQHNTHKGLLQAGIAFQHSCHFSDPPFSKTLGKTACHLPFPVPQSPSARLSPTPSLGHSCQGPENLVACPRPQPA